jgi:hypothetical protein
MGLIGLGKVPCKLKAEEVDRVRAWSEEETIELGITVGSPIEVVRGWASGKSTRVEGFTKKGVTAMLEMFSGWHLVEIAMEDIRAA